MTNDECPMTKEGPMPNDETSQPRRFDHSGFGIDSSFVIRHSSLTGSFCPLQTAWNPLFYATGSASCHAR
jgi:hypothetical protein